MGNYVLNDFFLITPFGGVDAILGTHWLKTLGKYVINHDEQNIQF